MCARSLLSHAASTLQRIARTTTTRPDLADVTTYTHPHPNIARHASRSAVLLLSSRTPPPPTHRLRHHVSRVTGSRQPRHTLFPAASASMLKLVRVPATKLSPMSTALARTQRLVLGMKLLRNVAARISMPVHREVLLAQRSSLPRLLRARLERFTPSPLPAIGLQVLGEHHRIHTSSSIPSPQTSAIHPGCAGGMCPSTAHSSTDGIRIISTTAPAPPDAPAVSTATAARTSRRNAVELLAASTCTMSIARDRWSSRIRSSKLQCVDITLVHRPRMHALDLPAPLWKHPSSSFFQPLFPWNPAPYSKGRGFSRATNPIFHRHSSVAASGRPGYLFSYPLSTIH